MFSDAEMKQTVALMQDDHMQSRATLHDVLMNIRNAYKDEPTIDVRDMRIIDTLETYLRELHNESVQSRMRAMIAINANGGQPVLRQEPAPASRPGADVIGDAPPSQPHRFEPPAPPQDWRDNLGPAPDPFKAPAVPMPPEDIPLPTMPSGGGVSTFAGVLSAPPEETNEIDAIVSRNAGADAGDPDFAAAAAAFSDRVAPETIVEETKVDPDFAHLHTEMARRTNEKA